MLKNIKYLHSINKQKKKSSDSGRQPPIFITGGSSFQTIFIFEKKKTMNTNLLNNKINIIRGNGYIKSPTRFRLEQDKNIN